MYRYLSRYWRFCLLALSALCLALGLATMLSLAKPPESFALIYQNVSKAQVLDRQRQALSVTYQNHWNIHDVLPLHEIPQFLKQAVVLAEDKRFYQHHGIDWRARLHALWQNIQALRAVRGASTISEQVVRLWHPRPRTLWSRWVEGFDAWRLENKFSKAALLEFYLNQVPYASQRRGVAQAARYYFNRDLDTLNEKEMLALAVLIRAPSRLDLYRDQQQQIEQPLQRLTKAALAAQLIDSAQLQHIQSQTLMLESPSLPLEAEHFMQAVYQHHIDRVDSQVQLQTTLNSELQRVTQALLNRRVEQLQEKQVANAAALIVEHQSNEVLAWVVAQGNDDASPNQRGTKIDAVQALRQPGSTLKPFVYAAALEKGWTASTLIEDEPLSQMVGYGLHAYQNYSRSFYGKVSLREALGNSLNIPAVKAVHYIGVNHFLSKLHQLGITSLQQHPDYYGDGLALGNGEISLYELVGAYAALARGGVYRPLKLLNDSALVESSRRVFSAEVSSLIGHILSDPAARQLEFGESGLLQLPVQTAVKTGTSSDYRDAWTLGYNHRYTVGVWMGNMDNTPMQEVTGSSGPAIVLRAIFAELNKREHAKPLYFSRKLVSHAVCIETGQLATRDCTQRQEWFLPGKLPQSQALTQIKQSIRIRQPSNGLMMAMDPRIPDDLEAFEFRLNKLDSLQRVDWYIDGQLLASSSSPQYVWPLARGQHRLHAEVWTNQSPNSTVTQSVSFLVK